MPKRVQPDDGGLADQVRAGDVRPHPGAQLRITDHEGWRITMFATNTKGGRLADLEVTHRLRARAEDRIRTLKDTGATNLPLHVFNKNQMWPELWASPRSVETSPLRRRAAMTTRQYRKFDNDPLRSFGIRNSRSPAVVVNVLPREPLRCAVRSALRSQGPAPITRGVFWSAS